MGKADPQLANDFERHMQNALALVSDMTPELIDRLERRIVTFADRIDEHFKIELLRNKFKLPVIFFEDTNTSSVKMLRFMFCVAFRRLTICKLGVLILGIFRSSSSAPTSGGSSLRSSTELRPLPSARDDIGEAPSSPTRPTLTRLLGVYSRPDKGKNDVLVPIDDFDSFSTNWSTSSSSSASLDGVAPNPKPAPTRLRRPEASTSFLATTRPLSSSRRSSGGGLP